MPTDVPPRGVDPQERLAAAAAALRETPDDPRAMAAMAGALHQSGRISEALAHWERALDLCLTQRQPVDAAAICVRILEAQPDHPRALALAGQLREESAARAADTGQRPRRQLRVKDGEPVVVHGRSAQPALDEEASTLEVQLSLLEKEDLKEQPASPAISSSGSGEYVASAGPASIPGLIMLPPDFVVGGRPRVVAQNEIIYQEGDASTQVFLLQQGRVEVVKWWRAPLQTRVAVVRAGECFGEVAMLGDGKRHLTARSLDPCQLRVFTREQIGQLMSEVPEVDRAVRALWRHRLIETLVSASPLLNRWTNADARAFLRPFRPVRLQADEVVIREGSPAAGFFLVLLGRLRVTKAPAEGGEPKVMAELHDCDFFGETSLLGDRPATATVRTAGFTQLLQLSAGDFHRLAERYPEFLAELDAEAKRRERSNKAVMHGMAYFDEKQGTVLPKAGGTKRE